MKTPPELDRITDVVLAYKPVPKTKAAQLFQYGVGDAVSDSLPVSSFPK